MSEEIWKPVARPEYAENYEVSNLGRVRRTTDGKGKARAGNVLTAHPNLTGHMRISLSAPAKHFQLHRLVLEAFVGPCPVGMEGCHNDDDGSNNRLDNLRWDTRSANQYDRKNRGVKIRGEGNGRAKITAEIARSIRDDARRSQEIAAAYGIDYCNVRRIKRGTSWADA